MALSYPFASYIFASKAHAWIRGLSQQAGALEIPNGWKLKITQLKRKIIYEKKNSMGSTVDFSGEYRQKPQIQWFSPMSKGFYLLGIHHIEDSDRWQAGLQCRVNMRDPKSKGKFFWIWHEVSSNGSLPLWMTQMSLLLEMTAENLHPVF